MSWSSYLLHKGGLENRPELDGVRAITTDDQVLDRGLSQ